MEAFVTDTLTDAVAALDVPALTQCFRNQDEFIVVEGFLPQPLLDACLSALDTLAPAINRNYIPWHKKGGSVSRFDLDRLAPVFGNLYRNTALVELLRTLTGEDLEHCPPNDPHTYALYYYTEPGDHIGFHYDTSYYRGTRYTVLLGLVDESSCRLECELYRTRSNRATESLSLRLAPGTLVAFNGDKLRHRITPAGANERRIALTLEYVTDVAMHPLLRFVSNMKDSIAYFGFRQVFTRSRKRAAD